MIEQESDSDLIEQIKKNLENAKEQYKQTALTIEKEEELRKNLKEIERKHNDVMLQQQHSHSMLLKQRLEAEKKRILERVLPNRFELSSVDVQPIAVKIIVQEGMYS